MKKIISLFLVFVILSMPAALAEEIDVKKYSYKQLELIEKAIRHEMMTRPEWKRVTVPVGIWKVGDDIPAGTYSIRATPEGITSVTLWRRAKDDYSSNGLILCESVIFDETDLIGKVIFEEGNVLEISGSPVYLCPPVSLEF